ncbi:unnamed protein product [Lota lota]
MSHSSHVGRHNKRVATSNLGEVEDDHPNFIAFDDAEEGAEPRDPLDVYGVDMLIAQNCQNHYTDFYQNNEGNNPRPLVVRRGKPFQMRIQFSRVINPDDFQLEFRIGNGLVMMVNFGGRAAGSSWYGQIDDASTPNVALTVIPSADAIVGKFRTYVGVVGGGGIRYTKSDNTDFYLLFNAWCEEDTVYMPDDAGRNEYVLNDFGLIFMGTAGAYSSRPWLYAQFDEGILDACIHILDRCRMPISDRGNAIKVTRQGSEIINSQDNDNGVLEGSWSTTFPNGTSPLTWTGSKSILQQYIQTGVSVRYGQCWVFAAVFNTFLRCLGLPSRVVSNFNSAHDNDGNLKIDLLYTPSGAADPRTRDSIWNFHCWNEVFMTRPDLPAGLGGWQCVDSTPQETSDGFYRCGPASIAAVKEGQVSYPYDSPFVFAEVNSDVIHSTRDKYGGLTTFLVEKDRVGLAVLTKAVGMDEVLDITNNYKYPEGSASDEQSMERAESFGLSRDHSELRPPTLILSIKTDQAVMKGQDVQLELMFSNKGDVAAEFEGSLNGSVVYYTGVEYSSFFSQPINLQIPQGQVETIPIKVPKEYYMPFLGSQNSLQFMITGQSGGTTLNCSTIITLSTQTLDFNLGGVPELNQEMFVEVSFVNPYGYRLTNVDIGMEGNGLFNYQKNNFGSIEAYGIMTWRVTFTPWRSGLRYIFALMHCNELQEVWGTVSVLIGEA